METPSPAVTAGVEEPAQDLPKTASILPLAGLLGFVLLAFVCGAENCQIRA